MDLHTAYRIFSLGEWCSNADIKSKYRTLVRQNHPDLGGSSQNFILVKDAYDYLIRYHKEPPQPKPGKTWTKQVYYLMEGQYKRYHKIEIPERILSGNVRVNCMWKTLEFFIILEKGKELPVTVEIKTPGLPFTFEFYAANFAGSS